MSTEIELNNILKIFKKKKFYKFSILRCISNYPTKIENTNLKSIDTLRKLLKKKFKNKNIKVGWSDHSKIWELF